MTRLDLTRDEIASAFYNSKYGVTLSGETFGHLSRYLEASSNSLQSGDDHLKHPLTVARIFRAKIDLRIAPEPPTGSCSKSESTNQIRISKEEMRLERESAQAAESLSKSVNEEKLKVILNAVRDAGPSPLPSTCLYKIYNENVGTCCTSISKDAHLMATGNEDSSVEIWDLLPSQQRSSLNSDVRNLAAQIPLGRFDQDDDDDDELPTVAPSDGKNRRILRGHSEPVYDVAFRSGHHRNIILSSCYIFINFCWMAK